MRFHLLSFMEVKSRSDKICPVEPGRHSVLKAGEESQSKLKSCLQSRKKLYFNAMCSLLAGFIWITLKLSCDKIHPPIYSTGTIYRSTHMTHFRINFPFINIQHYHQPELRAICGAWFIYKYNQILRELSVSFTMKGNGSYVKCIKQWDLHHVWE